LWEGIAAGAFPGASYAVLYHGEPEVGAAGRFTYERHSPEVRAETIYDLASLTKVIVTTAVAMLLYDRGQLDLDQRIVQLLPEFGVQDATRRKVTLRMLLQHNSGLPAYARLFETIQRKAALVRSALALPLEAEPGTRVAYSDPGFVILGAALERVAGTTLDVLCRTRVSSPLSALSLQYCPPAELRSTIPPTENDRAWRGRIIQGEVNDENASAMGGVAGHAGLFGNAGDLARFAAWMMTGGEPPVTREALSLFTTRSQQPPGNSYALGWDTPTQPSQSGDCFSPRSFGHLGFTGTSLWIDPERDLGVVLLTNRTWPDRNSQLIRQFRPKFHDAVVEALR
jgi:CubicO group peptidase (beta-lactamase class C family)